MNLPPLPFQPRPVRRLHRPDPGEVWARIYDEPRVLTGCLEGWELYRSLRAKQGHAEKLAVLRSLYGDSPMRYFAQPPGSEGTCHYGEDLRNPNALPGSIDGASFSAFAEQMLSALEGGSGEYIYSQSMPVEPGSALHRAMEPNVLYFLREQDVRPRIWVGSNGNVTSLHYDEFANFICMAEGTKRVTMFPPEALRDMYHMPFDRMMGDAQGSAVRLMRPDLERFPRFRDAMRQAQVAVVNPGEVLLIPPLWWHHVESFGLNVMVNNWVLMLSLLELVGLQRNLTRAIRLFHPRTARERAAARPYFQDEAFALSRLETPSGAERPTGEVAALLEETRRVLEPMHSSWRRWQASLYDVFVFQTGGEPFPAIPGELEALLARRAHSPYFFPNADFVDELVARGEL